MTYILSNVTNTVVYTGVTKALIRRVYEHKHKLDPGSFTAKYDVHKPVYFDSTSDVRSAIEWENQLKSWNQKKKEHAGRKHESAVGGSVRFHCAVTEADCHVTVPEDASSQ